jgi:predicted RecB family nuclease
MMVEPQDEIAQTWVTKTNVTDYLRCPYRFWLLHTGAITRDQLFGPADQAVLDEGNRFEAGIVAAALPIATPPGGPVELFAEDHVLLDVQTLYNPDLHLAGRPDGIVTANGRLEPIEIKAHRSVTHMDRLELAFYWVLLSAFRTRSTGLPKGWVYTRLSDGGHDENEVTIAQDLIEEVSGLIDEVRSARRVGVSPRECRCRVCDELRDGEVSAASSSTRDVSMIRGIGWHYREALVKSGYESWDRLLDGDAAAISSRVEQVTGQKLAVSEIRRWQAHALSYESEGPVLAGTAGGFPVPSEYLALDLEYVPGELIWIIGLRVVGAGSRAIFWLTDTHLAESEAIAELVEMLEACPALPVVTWNGVAADVPELLKAAARGGFAGFSDHLSERHIDLYQWTSASLFLPIPSLGLKELSTYLGVTRNAGVGSGREALMLWQQYQRSRKMGRPDTAIRDNLLAYNSEDVDCLIEVTEQLRDLSAGLPVRPGARTQRPAELDVRLRETPIVPDKNRGSFLGRLLRTRDRRY